MRSSTPFRCNISTTQAPALCAYGYCTAKEVLQGCGRKASKLRHGQSTAVWLDRSHARVRLHNKLKGCVPHEMLCYRYNSVGRFLIQTSSQLRQKISKIGFVLHFLVLSLPQGIFKLKYLLTTLKTKNFNSRLFNDFSTDN